MLYHINNIYIGIKKNVTTKFTVNLPQLNKFTVDKDLSEE